MSFIKIVSLLPWKWHYVTKYGIKKYRGTWWRNIHGADVGGNLHKNWPCIRGSILHCLQLCPNPVPAHLIPPTQAPTPFQPNSLTYFPITCRLIGWRRPRWVGIVLASTRDEELPTFLIRLLNMPKKACLMNMQGKRLEPRCVLKRYSRRASYRMTVQVVQEERYGAQWYAMTPDPIT